MHIEGSSPKGICQNIVRCLFIAFKDLFSCDQCRIAEKITKYYICDNVIFEAEMPINDLIYPPK